jgi:hypothetical protein
MASKDPLTQSKTQPDIEIGLSEALRKHVTRHLPAKHITRRRLAFERQRPTILRECVAEAMGVFFYVYVYRHVIINGLSDTQFQDFPESPL